MDFHCYLPDPWPILSFKTIEDLPISQFGIQLQQADRLDILSGDDLLIRSFARTKTGAETADGTYRLASYTK